MLPPLPSTRGKRRGSRLWTRDPRPADEVPCRDIDSANCTALRECYDDAIAAGSLLPADASEMHLPGAAREAPSGSVELYFLGLYFCFFAFIPSGSQLPYDALGQERACPEE